MNEEFMYYEEYAEFAVCNPEPEINPKGGQAALGVAAALGIATFAAAAWARLQLDTWKVNAIGSPSTRRKLAGAYLVAGGIGAGLAARPGTRAAAVIGTTLGVIVAQAPLLWDPFLIRRYPVMGNIWQYGVPIGGALLGVNAVS